MKKTIEGVVGVSGAAAYLGLSERTVRKWLKSGKIQGFIQEGKHGPEYVIELASLEGLNRSQPLKAGQEQGGISSVPGYLYEGLQREHLNAVHQAGMLRGQLEAVQEERQRLLTRVQDLEKKIDERLEYERLPWWKKLFNIS